jgi:hypothetical protein
LNRGTTCLSFSEASLDRLAKSLLANEIERFWKKIRAERSVKIANCLRALARV